MRKKWGTAMRRIREFLFRNGGEHCDAGDATMRALEVPHIVAFNGNDGCRGNASFMRDLYHRELLFRRGAFVNGCTPYRREYQLKGGTSTLAYIFFFQFSTAPFTLWVTDSRKLCARSLRNLSNG